MTLKLSVAFSDNLRVRPLIDGTVKPQNIDLEFIITTAGERHYRNLMYDEFDVSEMSISHTLVTREQDGKGRWDWSALPVFPSKIIPWSDFYVRTASGIKGLGDLKGKRVGVPDFQMTASLWLRAVLKELCDIDTGDITWFNGRIKELSHGAAVLGQDQGPPPGVTLNWLTEGQALDTMLAQGEIDAALFLEVAAKTSKSRGLFATFDRYAGTPLTGNPKLHKLFEDGGKRIATEYYGRTGVIPVNHFVIVQNRILREHPWVALELFKAFQRAKEVAYDRAREVAGGYLIFEGNDFGDQAGVFGEDPYPYGIRANRRLMDVIFQASFEQGLTNNPARIEDIFHSSIMDT